MSLSDSHRRHLLATLGSIDGLLGDVDGLLASVGAGAPLSRWAWDVTPVQRRVTTDFIARLRQQMATLLEALDVARPAPTTSCVWAIRTRLMKVASLLAEMEPAQLRGYGQLDPDTESAVRDQVAGLDRTLQRLSSYLSEGAQGYHERLERLRRAGAHTGLVPRLDEIVARHGLVEFRPALAHLVERLESPPRFEIAFFGRVSSGKSSLLNRLLGLEVLPVGVTPVTALPTRMVHGRQAAVEVAFADRAAATVPVERLAEFVAEEGNPGNARQVTRVTVHLPSPRLGEGIVLVDTPGVGSLAAGGAAEAVAYLPRCDLGVLLVDAGSTLTPEDLRLVHLLHESGVSAVVLVSKCDLLDAAERERAVRYVGEALAADLGATVPVRGVSALATWGEDLDDWFEAHIRPVYHDYREQSRVSVERKIGHLRDEVAAALRRRLATRQEGGPPAAATARLEVELDTADRRFEAVRQRCWEILGAVAASNADLTRAVAATVTSLSSDLPRTDAPEAVRRLVTEEWAGWGRTVYREVQALRDALQQSLLVLAEGGVLSSAPVDLQADVPLLELPTPSQILPPAAAAALVPPRLGRWSSGLARCWVRRRVASGLDGKLREGLARYADALSAWTQDRLERLDQVYEDAVAGSRHQLRQGAGPDAGAGPGVQEARRDLQALQTVPAERGQGVEEADRCTS